MGDGTEASVFQFHKGTIKAKSNLNTGEADRNFNSIKVQLKQIYICHLLLS